MKRWGSALALLFAGCQCASSEQKPEGLAYSANPAVYTRGIRIEANLPSSTGGAVDSYAVSPSLPPGLGLDAVTGIVSGTPTAVVARAGYTVTAANGAGQASVVLSITVNDAAPTALSYSSNPALYTKGTRIPDDVPSSSGGAVVSYSVSPALPSGLGLDEASGIISGTPGAVAPTGTYVVTAANSGGETTAALTITVRDAVPAGLAYPTNPAVYTKGVAIAPNAPSNSGGAVVAYSVAPPLPPGLGLDATTGVIAGTATAIAARATYTVSAVNSGGTATVALVITVNDAAPILSYAPNPAVYTRGVAIAPNAPVNTGGAVVAYSVAPALPPGLNLNTTTGVITGTPMAIAERETYAVTGTNSGGSATVALVITVNDQPSSLSYTTNPAIYTKGVAIAPNPPINTGGPVISYSVDPALPPGLNLNTTTGVITGTPTAVAARGTYAVTGTNSGGTAIVALVITVNDVPPAFAYTTNPAVYTKGVAITPDAPINTGGAVVSYSVTPALPAGLALNGATGVVTGTPTAIAARATYSVTATNSGGTATVALVITVSDVPPAFTYATNPAVYTKGVAITPDAPINTGGAVVSYSVTPVLPAGLALNGATGVVTGTPTAIAARATYSVTATNSGGSATVALVITVNDAPPAFTYSLNPAAYTRGVAIAPNAPVNTGGAVVSYTVTPALPAGLALSATTGVIAGTPTAVTARATYTVTGTNSGGSATVALVIAVNDVPPAFTYSVNPAAYTRGVAIAPNAPVSSGGAVVSYSVTPALPAGLALNGTTGVVTGTPTALAARATYSVTATNSGGSATVALVIAVNDVPLAFTYSVNPAAYTRGVAIAPNAPVNTGGAVVSYTVTPALPAGLALSATTGVITGTPTAITARATYSVTATNSGGSATVALVIAVNDVPPVFTYSVNPATYMKGVAISPNAPINTGGAVVSYSVTPALPAGLALNGTTGVVTGTPTVATASATHTVTGTNSGGSATVALVIAVNDTTPAFTYSVNPAIYTRGVAIAPNAPINTGRAVVSYSVTPALPAGLSLNTTTGVVSGTPTAIALRAPYTVTGINSGGSATVALLITVNDVAPAFTYSVNPAIYTRGVAIAPNAPVSSGGTVVSYAVSPALPAGLRLNTATGVVSGTPTAIAATASYTVTGTNSGGSARVALVVTVNSAIEGTWAGVVADTYLCEGTSWPIELAITGSTLTIIGGTAFGVGLTGTITEQRDPAYVFSFPGEVVTPGQMFLDAARQHAQVIINLGGTGYVGVLQKTSLADIAFQFSDLAGEWDGQTIRMNSALNVTTSAASTASIIESDGLALDGTDVDGNFFVTSLTEVVGLGVFATPANTAYWPSNSYAAIFSLSYDKAALAVAFIHGTCNYSLFSDTPSQKFALWSRQ